MPVTATFDSNVWRQVVSPDKYPQDRAAGDCKRLHEFSVAGSLKGMLSETMFDLEAIPKKKRADYFGSYEPKTVHTDVAMTAHTYHGRVAIGPDLASHPGNSDYHNQHLADAIAIGFRLLTCPRIGMPKSPDTLRTMFLAQTNDDLKPVFDRLGEALEFVSSLGAGIEHARALGNRYRKPSDRVWYEAFPNVPDTERHLVPKVVAEWADGDSIATHIAHQIEYFCTRDQGVSAGNKSILAPENRKALKERFGVVFVTPEELCEIVVKRQAV